MKLLLLVILIISFTLILHTYLLYPLICFVWSKIKSIPNNIHSDINALPFVSFIMPLHNEEKVLRQKIESLINLNYPTHKIKCYFGSDASTDQTNAILSTWEDRQHVFYKNTRTGKPGMVNFLVEKAIANYAAGAEHILLFTDASVMLDSDCLINLVKHFKNPDMGLVDANMINKGVNKNNISAAESRYVSLEVKLKHWESKINRKMIGPFGGCFALRSDFFSPIPNNFLVDDFYLCMEVFRKGGHAINALDAISYESVSEEIQEEFRRKVRIGAGNLQNMVYFHSFLSKPFLPISFFIYSHKVIRWFVPVLAILVFLTLTGLSMIEPNPYFLILLVLIFATAGIPLVEFLLNKLKIVVLPVKNLNYFIWMNLALLKGIINYYKGIKTNVWQPTKRY